MIVSVKPKLLTLTFKAHYILIFAFFCSLAAPLIFLLLLRLPMYSHGITDALNPLWTTYHTVDFYESFFFSSKSTCIPWVLISSRIRLRKGNRSLTVLPVEWFYNLASQKYAGGWTIQTPFVFSVDGRK